MNIYEAGVAMSAALSSCRHEHVEPVDLSTGERVAAICADCLREVPVDWA